MKKVLIAMLCLIFCFGLMTGCGGGGGDDSSADGDKIMIRIASDETSDTPCSEATEIFKKQVEEKSGGKMTVEYFCDSAMGDEREIAESVNMGNLEMGIISGCYLATYDENWYLVDMPYVFSDREAMYKHLDGEVGQILKDGLKKNSKIECLDFADGSFKVLLNSKKEVKTVKDIANLKFRSQESQMNMSIYKAWKSTAVPMGFSEIYTALQQGTVDGVDTSPLYQRSGKFYEVGKYYTMTNHQALLMTSIINTDFMASLPEDMQQVIRDASKEAYGVQERSIVKEAEEYACKVMDDAGCKRHDLTDAELKTFKDASVAVYDEYSKVVDPKLYELMGL
ncbi:TRAP transporter substrate-binding protein [Anaerovorax odorimutans]|uniref:TRAP transporter substrate-binding protein n=1 Tax=Anaerovorax odorimutans TaxID=109327 RepID=A0ABT1RNY3_9FIRM|nr:TRAP transporter substrate-binding protein [Anaerovorax odorimutans]MCQ4636899.1 TRAP transporter substrate-binding protein [Anaerovorax odorimutans]